MSVARFLRDRAAFNLLTDNRLRRKYARELKIFGSNRAPETLFRNSEKGVWYDPSDFSTMFQDAAGTTPVTATGQPVGLIRDKSGRGNHASQTTAASRPVLQVENGKYYLTFDGVDDWLQTANIDFSATDKMTVVAGVRKLSDAAIGCVAELSADAGPNAGTWFLLAPRDGSVGNYGFRSAGSLVVDINAATFAAPVTSVLSCSGNIAGDLATIRVNGGAAATNAADQGAGNYGNYPLYIGRRGGTSLPFNGRLYSLIVRGALSDTNQITQAESYVNLKTGAY